MAPAVVFMVVALSMVMTGEVAMGQDMAVCNKPNNLCFGQQIFCPQECPQTNPSGPNSKACVIDCNRAPCTAICRGSNGEVDAGNEETTICNKPQSPCFGQQIVCPPECPFTKPLSPTSKACFVNCNTLPCEAICKAQKPNCNGNGAGCLDPRFIGGDGVVFYFHGRRDEHYALVSDRDIQINARFIGLRPAGRPRDFTWIQALGIMSGSYNFTIEAMRATEWDENIDHLSFSINNERLSIPEGHISEWRMPGNSFSVKRTSSRNSVTVKVGDIAEIAISAVPVDEEDNRIHNYQIPPDDCFSHLEVQFSFLELSPAVDGVVGRTYRADYESPAKMGDAMAVVGGEDEWWTSSLLSTNCKRCVYGREKMEGNSFAYPLFKI